MRLIRNGHSLDQVANYTLEQFTLFLEGVTQVEAQQRIGFITDLTSIVGTLYRDSKDKGDSPITVALQSLTDISNGVREDASAI